MTTERQHYLRVWALALAVGICVAGLGSCGCRGGDEVGSVEDLLIRRYRTNIDKDHGVVRVVGEVENAGPGPVKEVEVHAILRKSSGSKCGVNMTVLKNIEAGELRTFSLRITSHGRAESVQLELAEPSPPP